VARRTVRKEEKDPDPMDPPYVRLARRLPMVGRYQPTTVYLISSAGLLVPFFALSTVTGHSSSRNELLAMFFVVGLISAGIVLLANAHSVVRGALVLMPSMFTSERQQELLKDHMQTMLQSPYQYLVAVGFGTLGCYLLWRLDAGLTGIVNALFMVYVFLAFLTMGFGLWLAVATLRWISIFPEYGRFHLFAIPSRTVALRQVSKVTGVFALSFSLETGLSILSLLTVQWGNQDFFRWLTPLLIGPFGVLCVVFFVYPQLALMKIHQRSQAGNRRKAGAVNARVRFRVPRWRRPQRAGPQI
jgi:hypothetical protein